MLATGPASDAKAKATCNSEATRNGRLEEWIRHPTSKNKHTPLKTIMTTWKKPYS